MALPHDLDVALYDKLRLDATLQTYLGNPARVYRSMAPEGVAFPFAIFNLQSASDRYVFTGRKWVDFVYLAKGIDQSPDGVNALAIAARIDVLLTDQTLTVAGTAAMYVRRESLVSYEEQAMDLVYQHAGGLFRIQVLT